MNDVPAHTPDVIVDPVRDASPVKSVALYDGPVSLWLAAKPIFFAVLLAAAGLFAAGYAQLYGGSSIQTPLTIGGLALFLASALMLAYTIISVRVIRYKITTRLIERESGILMKRVDALDLARVKDVEFTQSIVDRMLGLGTIEVYSSDRTDPTLMLEAIPNARPLYEKLRDAVIEISQRRGIVPMN
jgi:uncharacterized membrane protein YdbT with pleckstrin-like domain